jgi:predicted nucleic acid-binding protein
MIHLDTNFLIMSLAAGTPQDVRLRALLSAGERVQVDAVVWSEFLCGPLTVDQLGTAQAIVPHVEAFTAQDSERAAELFNVGGRRRGSLTDCMIAAVCLRLGASLATSNVGDLRPFEGAGLRIVTG